MNLKRLLAFSLSMAMMISAMPALVLADEADSGSTETTITETTEPKENETEKTEEKKPEEAEDKKPAHPENEGEKTVESKSEDAEEEKQQTETAKQTAKNAAAQKIPGCNLTWYIDASTKTLVISGKGKMSKMYYDSDCNPEVLFKKNKENGIANPKIYMACGAQDFLLEPNHQMRDFLKEEKADFTYEEEDGVHDWSFWTPHAYKVIDYLLKK